MNIPVIGKIEGWLIQHKKAYHTALVSTFVLIGLFPGAVVYYIWAVILERHITIPLLAHVAFVCGGAALLVFGLLLGILTGCIYFVVDTQYINPQRGN